MFASAVYYINTTIMSNPLGENEYPRWVLLPVVLSLILVTYKVKDLWFGIRTNRTFCQSTGKIHSTLSDYMNSLRGDSQLILLQGAEDRQLPDLVT